MKKVIFFISTLLLGSLLTACSMFESKPVFKILAGSENEILEPLLQEYAKGKDYEIEMVYKGSVDSMLELQETPEKYDAVWLANSTWITMGDEQSKVKHEKSIMSSPIVFGIKKSKAEELGLIDKDVKIADILNAVNENKLNFIMTSASQSNSGNSAYIGMLYALLDNPEILTTDDLHDPELKDNIRKLFNGINRSSGSSGWLKDLALTGDYEAMVNYEALIIEANQQLEEQGKEPYYAVYPVDGLTIADHTLGYVSNDDVEKEEFFKGLQEYLLSEETQNKILELGRRTGFGGKVTAENSDVFKKEWGIDLEKVITPQKFPSEDVMWEALNLYQSNFKKPSFTVFALDYSGSMSGDGEKALEEAMSVLLDQEKAKQYFLQSSPEDKVIVIPFSSSIIDFWEVEGAKEYDQLLNQITSLETGGGTDIYTPVIEGLDILKEIDVADYNPAVILMTDGQSNDGQTYEDLHEYFMELEKDIPVFSITFGDADESQLEEIADLTRGKVFDGKENLVQAFKQAKGYN